MSSAPAADRRRHALLGFAAAHAVAALTSLGLPLLIVASVIALSTLYLLHRHHTPPTPPTPHHHRTVALLATAVALGALLGLSRTRTPLPEQAVSIQGVVSSSRPDQGRSGRLVLAEPEFRDATTDSPLQLPTSLHRIYVNFKWFTPPPLGSTVRVTARLRTFRRPDNPTTTPPSPPYPSARAVAALDPLPHHAPSWRTATALAATQTLTFEDPEIQALYRALLLGDRTDLPPDLRVAYQDTGTSHLLAISGMHLAVFGYGTFRLTLWLFLTAPMLAPLMRRWRPRACAAALALALSTAYTLIIVPSDSATRALIILTIAFGAVLLRRRASAAYALTLALAAIALFDPDALLHAGLQLSFAAAASLIAIAPTVRAWRDRVRIWLPDLTYPTGFRDRLRRPLRATLIALGALVLADIATALVTAPLTLAWFGQLAPHGLWVNLIAIPLMTLLVMPVAVFWTLLATLSPSLGATTAQLPIFFGETLNDFIRWSASRAGSTSAEAWPLALGLLAALALLVLLARTRHRLLAALTLTLTSAAALAHTSPPPGLTLTAFDVGHGDAIALQLPTGPRLLIDTGGSIHSHDDNRAAAERVLIPALRSSGIAAIDVLILTHAHADHIGAAVTLAERVPIGELWLNPCALSDPTTRRIAAHVRAQGGTVRTLSRSLPFDYGGVTLEILAPNQFIFDPNGHCRRSTNDSSLVLRVSYAGRHLLFTGDIEARAEAELVAAYHHIGTLRADLLKAPHHGSKTSSTDALLDQVGPHAAAIVSGLLDHPPMPPHAVTFAHYAERGLPTFITGRDGAISAHIAPDGALHIGPWRSLADAPARPNREHEPTAATPPTTPSLQLEPGSP